VNPQSLVILHVLRRLADEVGELRIAMPGLSPEERVVLWEGFPPPPGGDHAVLAPIVLAGSLDGRPAYAEQVPVGLPMSLARPPEELLRYVVVQILRGLAVLHAGKQVHGAIAADRVMLGQDGEVVLIGRGRRGGLMAIDLIGAVSLLPPTGDDTLPGESATVAADELERKCPADAREQLSAFVRARVAAEPPPGATEQVVLAVGGLDEGADEVQLDIGPDGPSDEGILDRWTVTGGTTSGGESTPEATDGRGTSHQRLAEDLWLRLANLREGPADRFAEVEGSPSRGLRALIADEPPDPVPVPLVARIRSFAVSEPVELDQPTIVAAVPNTPKPAYGAGSRPRGVRWTELVLAMLVGGAVMWVLMRWL
jgi:hypothetical protein